MFLRIFNAFYSPVLPAVLRLSFDYFVSAQSPNMADASAFYAGATVAFVLSIIDFNVGSAMTAAGSEKARSEFEGTFDALCGVRFCMLLFNAILSMVIIGYRNEYIVSSLGSSAAYVYVAFSWWCVPVLICGGFYVITERCEESEPVKYYG